MRLISLIHLGSFILFQFSVLGFVSFAPGKTSRFINRSIAHMSTDSYRGLLSGVSDIKSTQYYSDTITIKEAAALVTDQKRLFNICLENASGDLIKMDETLNSVIRDANAFMKSGEVWDREELVSFLEEIIESDDHCTFACILAGRSTGKTLVLNNLQRQFPETFFCVDLRRKGSDILTGLVDVLEDKMSLNPSNYKTLQNLLMQAIGATANFIVKSNTPFDVDFRQSLDIVRDSSSMRAFEVLIEQLIKKLGPITLVIDEANLALTIHERMTPDEIKATNQALAIFTSLTKVNRQLNVILVSSEHSFPFRLLHPELNFQPDTFTEYLYAGEVSPKAMYELLTVRWGMASNLATAFIDYYGGHIYDIHEALKRLKKRKGEFKLFDTTLSNNVRRCLNWKGGGLADQKRMRNVLSQLVKTGFYQLELSDPVAEIISKHNVGGVVQSFGQIIGMSPALQNSPKFKNGIIPAKQSMRLVIAEELCS